MQDATSESASINDGRETTMRIDQGNSDKTPATLSNNKTGGDDFLGNEGEDDNRTTKHPRDHGVGDGDRDSAAAVGMASNDDTNATDTQNGGGGL